MVETTYIIPKGAMFDSSLVQKTVFSNFFILTCTLSYTRTGSALTLIEPATHKTYTKARLREPSLAEEGVDYINSHKADRKNWLVVPPLFLAS